MKYIIDLPDNCSWVQWVMTSDKDGHAYFDFKSPEDLTTLDKELDDSYQKGLEEGKKQAKVQAQLDVCHDIERVARANYQKGLDDAWEAAKKIFGYEFDGGLPIDELRNVFGIKGVPFCTADIIMTNTASEALAKLKAYEEQQKADEIKVGDEVEWEGEKIIVTQTFTPNLQKPQLHGIGSNGCVYYVILIEDVKKTGRHFPQVVELLKAMKEGAE